ncbi:uncharacterized protein J4E79_007425 [Alternaria viburni]|uniref:uncharacterized protein n=1 Tax=Alternaria viburni TaxID=566460 RepID=UPI0020C48B77|nr:uncharacterized protein J4E79_007425 [Alternaria viburni]KAI4657352.1 hypothetical protein J4E79_007425 [Alternaria viburni]
MNEKEMRRHGLFWGVISPADLGKEANYVRIKMLREGLEKLKAGRVAEELASPVFPYFTNDLKRELDEPIPYDHEILSSKKIKSEEFTSDGVDAAIPSHAGEYVNRYWGKQPENPWTPERSEDEKNLMSQHEACRAKQTFVAAMGTYWIQCPLIEHKHPELKSSLRMVVQGLDDHTQERGLLEAHLNLGLLKGTMVMGPGLDIVQDWCYRHQSQRSRDGGNGKCRIDKDTERLRDVLEELKRVNELPMDAIIKSPPLDLRKPLDLDCEARLYENRPSIGGPIRISGNTAHLEFRADNLYFEGKINLPMISDTPVKISGHRIKSDDSCTVEKWLDYDTSKVKYGAVWNEF